MSGPASVDRRAVTRGASRGIAVALGLVALAMFVALVAADLTGATAPLLLADPGPAVRWGIVVARAIGDVTAALTVGLLVLAAVVLPVSRESTRETPRANPVALMAAAVTSTAWAAVTVALLVLSFADAAGQPVGGDQFGDQLIAFVRDVDLGRGLAVTAVVAAAVGILAAGASTVRSAGWLAVLSFVALVPPALAGHAAGSSDHETAVTALGLHLLAVCAWAGGLAALVLIRPSLTRPQLLTTARRFSRLAGWAFPAVAGSGVVSAWVRLGGVGGLASRYGAVVLAKSAALVALGVAGWWQRRRVLPALEAGRSRAFARLVGVELGVMAVALGLAAALSRSAPPSGGAPGVPVDLAQSRTGYPMPPRLDATRWLTEWRPDLLWLLVAALGVGLYLAGVRRLRSRGDSWGPPRTLGWLGGLALLVYVTSGPPAVYGRVLFSSHMVAHMLLSMAVPMLLVLGAPITLAMRALRARDDGTRGAREWLLAILGSRFLRVVTFAPVAAVLFAGSLVIFYYSPLFELALTTHVGHELMALHFLLVGYVFVDVLMGTDPLPHRPLYPLRLVVLFATMAFHAFFGLALMNGTTVLASGYFGELGRTWGASVLADQQLGGGIAWGIGDLPTLLMALIIAIQWARSDEREARRRDRAADRDGDAELVAYNAMLARLAASDQRQQEREARQSRP